MLAVLSEPRIQIIQTIRRTANLGCRRNLGKNSASLHYGLLKRVAEAMAQTRLSGAHLLRCAGRFAWRSAHAAGFDGVADAYGRKGYAAIGASSQSDITCDVIAAVVSVGNYNCRTRRRAAPSYAACSVLLTFAKINRMHDFPVHTIDSAPEQSKSALRDLQKAFGIIPNIAGAMATSPVLIGSLVGLFTKVHGGSFTDEQIQTLLLTNAVTNACTWAVAFHTALALNQGVNASDVQAIRERRTPHNPGNAALSTLARTLIEKRGHLEDHDAARFLEAGFGKDHLLEVIAVVAASTITNYTGSVTMPPVEAPFQEYVWNAS